MIQIDLAMSWGLSLYFLKLGWAILRVNVCWGDGKSCKSNELSGFLGPRALNFNQETEMREVMGGRLVSRTMDTGYR